MIKQSSFVIVSLFLLLNVAIAAETSDSKVVTVKQSSPEFSITLKSNPTTGYRWFLKGCDAANVIEAEQMYLPPTSQLVGAPGHDKWTFKLLPKAFATPSHFEINLIYARAWEKDPVQTYHITVYTTQ